MKKEIVSLVLAAVLLGSSIAAFGEDAADGKEFPVIPAEITCLDQLQTERKEAADLTGIKNRPEAAKISKSAAEAAANADGSHGDEPTDDSVKLDVRAYTKMGFYSEDNSDMTRLHDGKYDAPVIINVPGGVVTEDSYIDFIFNGDICTVTKFFMTCNKGLQPDQSLTGFKLYSFDDHTGEWIDEQQEYSIAWDETDPAKPDNINAAVCLDSPITTSRIRLKFLTVAASWDTIRFMECAPYGVYLNHKIEDISKNAEITSNLSFEHGGLTEVQDKSFATEFRSNTKVTPENCGMITYNFNDQYFNIQAVELVSLFASHAGIKTIDVEYKENGQWVPLYQGLTFTRPNGLGSDKYELDRIDINKITNGIRILIKETYFEWSHFRVSDIMIYGDPSQRPIDPNDYDALIGIFETSEKYSDYLAVKNKIDEIQDEAEKKQYAEKLELVVSKIKKKETLETTYDAFGGKVTVQGFIFAEPGSTVNLELHQNEKIDDIPVVIGEDYCFAAEYDMRQNTNYGEYTIQYEDLTAAFTHRLASDLNDIISFKIDGKKAVITENSVEIAISYLSNLKDRVPVFTLSDGAAMYLDDSQIISGETKIDFTNPVTVKVVAENGGEKAYTIKVTKEKKPAGGSGGSGGAPSGGGNGSVSAGGGTGNGAAISILPEAVIGNKIKGFADVDETHWAYSYINQLKLSGIVTGDENNHFRPDAFITREEFVKMAVCKKQYPIVEKESLFQDTAGRWSSKYIATGVENGIINGVSKTEFLPCSYITRQDMAVVVYNMLGDIDKTASDALFNDDVEISEYAREAVYTLKAFNVISGVDNSYHPKAYATRAEVAKILCGIE